MTDSKAKSNTELAQEFVDDLFGSYDRLVCSRTDEDEGRAGWSKQPVVDNVQIVIATAQSQLARQVIAEIQVSARPTALAVNVVRDLFTRLNIATEDLETKPKG
jgi:hypothetical protein